jgi:hypothetical protein
MGSEFCSNLMQVPNFNTLFHLSEICRSALNAIAFFGLGSFASGSTNGVSYFVGTQAEAAAEAARF